MEEEMVPRSQMCNDIAKPSIKSKYLDDWLLSPWLKYSRNSDVERRKSTQRRDWNIWLEPRAGKLAGVVLRGERISNDPDLLDRDYRKIYKKCQRKAE